MWDKFIETTTRHFRFLETDLGFTSKTAKPPFAIYESSKVQVLVYYDVNGRHELDLRVRNLSDDPRKTPRSRDDRDDVANGLAKGREIPISLSFN